MREISTLLSFRHGYTSFEVLTDIRQMGNRHIERGLKAVEEENFGDGIRLLRLGLIRSPENLKGLVTLAQICEWT